MKLKTNKQISEKKGENYYEYLFLLFATIVFIDRMLKTFLQNSCFWEFCIKRVTNSGAAFGILPGMTWFFIAVALAILIAIILFIGEFEGMGKFALIFMAAGTAANMIDRIFFHYVIDLFSVFGSSSFNLADMLNCIGAVMLLVILFRKK